MGQRDAKVTRGRSSGGDLLVGGLTTTRHLRDHLRNFEQELAWQKDGKFLDVSSQCQLLVHRTRLERLSILPSA